MIKSTYRRCNALLNQRGRKVTTINAFDQVYTQVLNKAMEDTQRKTNSYIDLEFDRCDTRFLV